MIAWWVWLCIAVVVTLAVAAAVAWAQAARIDRLHRRISQGRLSLDRHLVKRSAGAVRLADTPSLPGPDADRLRGAAEAALDAAQHPLAADTLGGLARPEVGAAGDSSVRLAAESRLSQVLREQLTDQVRSGLEASPATASALQALDLDSYRVRVARNLHNQDVASVRLLRRRPLARLLHLSGHAPLPEFVDLDDE